MHVRRQPHLIQLVSLACVAGLISACGGGGDSTGGTVQPAVVATVVVTPGSGSMSVSGSSQFAAAARTAAGSTVSGAAIAWTVEPTTLASVDGTGRVTGLAAGNGLVVATSSGIRGTATLVVTPLPIATVTVTPASTSLLIGQNAQFSLTAANSLNQPVTPANTVWSVEPTSIATIDATGKISAVAAGTATVVATADGIRGTAALTVQAVPVASVVITPTSGNLTAGGTLQLQAVARDSINGTLTARTITWSSTNAGVASVSATGLVTAVASGSASITAATGGKSAAATVTVSARSDIATILDSLRRALDMPALGGAIVTSNGTYAIGVAGTRRYGANIPVTLNDKWRIGSDFKSMTGVVAARLVEAGLISWTRTLAETFPELVPVMRDEWKNVTLEQLLTHRGGFERNADWTIITQPTPLAQRLAALEWAVKRAPAVNRGVYLYSNIGFMFAGAIIERTLGKPFEQVVTEQLIPVMGFTRFGWGPPATPGANNEPLGHSTVNNVKRAIEPVGLAGDFVPGFAPAGWAHMSMVDWSQYIQWVLAAEAGRTTGMTNTMSRKLLTGAVSIDLNTQYAFGWTVNSLAWAGGRTLSHTGEGGGWTAVVYAATVRDVGILVVTNDLDRSADLNLVVQRLNSYYLTGK